MRAIYFLTIATLANGQSLHVGVKGGVPLSDFFVTDGYGSRDCACFSSFYSRPVRYAMGPSVEVPLPFRFSLEVDAVYQRFHYSFIAGYGFLFRVVSIGATTGNSWDF